MRGNGLAFEGMKTGALSICGASLSGGGCVGVVSINCCHFADMTRVFYTCFFNKLNLIKLKFASILEKCGKEASNT